MSLRARPRRGRVTACPASSESAMKILVVHGRYRSLAPSGENHVVDQERVALRAAGHEVDTFERHSDEIADWRSEEHTSELQSLMRNSYAVFCLKKKKTTYH